MPPLWPAQLPRDRAIKGANWSSRASSRKPATEGFLQTRFVVFCLDKLYTAGGKEDGWPASWPALLPSRHAWLLQCLMGGMCPRRRPGSLQILDHASNHFYSPKASWGKGQHAVPTRCCHRAQLTQERGVLKNQWCPGYHTSSWRRLLEFHVGLHLGTQRLPPSHCSYAGPPPVMPQLLLVTKVLPSVCYHSGFHGSFWANGCAGSV